MNIKNIMNKKTLLSVALGLLLGSIMTYIGLNIFPVYSNIVNKTNSVEESENVTSEDDSLAMQTDDVSSAETGLAEQLYDVNNESYKIYKSDKAKLQFNYIAPFYVKENFRPEDNIDIIKIYLPGEEIGEKINLITIVKYLDGDFNFFETYPTAGEYLGKVDNLYGSGLSFDHYQTYELVSAPVALSVWDEFIYHSEDLGFYAIISVSEGYKEIYNNEACKNERMIKRHKSECSPERVEYWGVPDYYKKWATYIIKSISAI